MKRTINAPPPVILVLISLFVVGHVSAQTQQPLSSQTQIEYVQSEVIVKFKETAGPSQVAALSSELQAAVLQPLGFIGAELWSISGVTVEEAVARYRTDPRIEYIEPNYIYHAFNTVPNDPRFDDLWGMNNTGQTGGLVDVDVDAPEAWDIATGDYSVLVGVIDTGVDYTHEDLVENIWTNFGEIPGNGIDDDGNGYVDDFHGWDFAYGDNNPMDGHSHGTHVAGTIGAAGNNGKGVAGVCWRVKILPIKFLNDAGAGTTANAVLSVQYATLMGAKLTNNSWGGGAWSQALKDAISAANAAGILFVAAAGNDYTNTDDYPVYPACYDVDNVISVANIMHDDQLRPSSNYGLLTVDLGAPGTDVLSTTPGNGYSIKSGTSMASPHVAGAAALLWSAAPTLSHHEVKDIIFSSVEPTAVLAVKTATGGRLNLFNMLNGLDSIPPDPVYDLEISEIGSSTVTLTFTASGDDGTSGTARSYDIRYSTEPLDPSNFDSAASFVDVPAPQPSGTTEILKLKGLDFNTLYYFALKVLDETGNASLVSNVVYDTTLGVPGLVFAPQSVNDTLLTGGVATHAVTIKNAGLGILDFEFLNLDEPGVGQGTSPANQAAVGWLTASPREGSVPSGDSVDVQIRIDSAGLLSGVYTTNVELASNDPAWPLSTLPVRLWISCAADLAVSPGSLDFGRQFQGETVSDTITVLNNGCDSLYVSGVSTDHADYSVDPSGFALAPGRYRYLVIGFHPAALGVIPATLSIFSNDPYEPVLTVPLSGESVIPPGISIAPPLMVEALATGESTDRTLTITNSGEADLEWRLSFEDSANATAKQYTLTTPPLFAEPAEKEAPDSRPRAVRTMPVVAKLQDLTGKKILWDTSHGQTNTTSWSTMVSDLMLRGATVTESSSRITPALLENYDVLWTVDSYVTWTPEELAALRNWLAVRGALLVESDQNTAYNNLLLEGTGVVYSQTAGIGGITTKIYRHATTAGVDSVYLQYPLAQLSTLQYPAFRLVDDAGGRMMCAGTRYGGGRIVVLADEVLSNYAVSVVDNQIFGNQIFDWLTKSVQWLSADATEGTVAGYSSHDAHIIFDATGMKGGLYEAYVVVASNDPDNTRVGSRAVLVVTAAPDIRLTGYSFDFGEVFTGVSEERSLFVMNNGVTDLSVSHILTSDSDYSVDNTAMVIPPGGIHPLTITFAPTKAGDVPAFLSVVSNDPDEGVVEVTLTGRGLIPPVIQVDPAVFIANLLTGGTAEQTLGITNAGATGLDWELEIEGLTRIPYVKGLKILYDRTHGQEALDPGFVAALETRGATVTSSLTPITRDLLDQYDVFIFKNTTIDFMFGQISDLAGWVQDGGDIVFIIDGSSAIGWANQLLNTWLTAGFRFENVPPFTGRIYDLDRTHFAFYDVASIYFPHGEARIVGVQSPAVAIARAGNGDVVCAASDLGEGRIIAVCDDVDLPLQPGGLYGGGNRKILLQAIAWTGADFSTHWVNVSQTSGSTAAGNTDTPQVAFDATELGRGTYQANLKIRSNDPVNPEVTIPAFLGVTPASDILLPADSVDFGVTFTSTAVVETLAVYNRGWLGLIGTITVEGTSFGITGHSQSFVIGRNEQVDFTLEYHPVSEGPHTGVLTLESDDPDSPVVTVQLRGEAVAPPEISVSPASLDETLYTGESSTRPMYIQNVGAADLAWSLTTTRPDSSGPVLRTYTLNAPPPDAPPPDGETTADAPNRVVASRRETARLLDLTGVRIMWESAHGQVSSYLRSTIIADLTARGATISTNYSAITLGLLADYDVVWTADANYLWTPEEASALLAWIQAGGAMLFESDQSQSVHNRILTSIGVQYSTTAGTAGTTTNIYPHAVTEGVHSVWLGGPLATIGLMYPPAVKLFDDVSGLPTGAATTYGSGRVVVVCDELFDDYSIAYEDNQLLGNQVVDWLAGGTWLTVAPKTGILAAGETDTLSAAFSATTEIPGQYHAQIIISSNDPLRPELFVPVTMNVLAAPDISLTDSALYYGAVFVGQTENRQLQVKNVGYADLLITSLTTDDADFSVSVDSVVVPPKSQWDGVVSFTPSRVGSITATLTLICNDPDEPVAEVVLGGTGVDPPVIAVSPDSLSATLYSGGAATRSLYVENTGGSDLDWIANVLPPESNGVRTYTLAVPPAEASPPDKGQPASPVRPDRTATSAVPLRDIDGVRVLWDRSHGQQSMASWSTLVSDISARGASVTENYLPLTPSLLSGYDVMWLLDMTSALAQAELLALHDWIFTGGSLLIEADESMNYINPILSGMGLQFINFSASPGKTTYIYPHEITSGVSAVWLGNPLSYFGILELPASRLVDDIAGRPVGAVTRYGSGRVVAFSDEIFSDYGLGNDNQILGNQVFDWFSNVPWLFVVPVSGTTAAGAVDTLAVNFRTAGAQPGRSDARLLVFNNDPANPEVAVHVSLELIASPDIVADSTLEFGAVYVGLTEVKSFYLSNDGTADLHVTGFSADDPDYSCAVDSLTIPPRTVLSLDVEFTPSRAETILATLAITSDDPDEPVYLIHLSGRGVLPPAIAVAPDTLREALYSGETATRWMYVENTGGSDLIWKVDLYEPAAVGRGLYTLTQPPVEASPPGGEVMAEEAPRIVRTERLVVPLSDLTGKRIMWEMSHGQGSSLSWSTMISDLVTRGATITENSATVTPALLDLYDVVWTVDSPNLWTTDEVSAVRAWINAGGALLIESDQYETKWNDFLTGTGIHVSTVSATSGTTTRIYPHEITKDVTSVWLGGPLAHLDVVTTPAARLVDDKTGRATGVASVYGVGRMVIFTDEMFNNYSIANADNQLLGNQVFDWLAGTPGWLSVTPERGTTAGGVVDTLRVTFDATKDPPGLREADILVRCNDPVTPEATVAAILQITGVSDIAVSDSLLDFGTVIIGAARSRNLTVYNHGNRPLVVSNVTTRDSTVYSPSSRSFVVGEGASYVLQISFTPGLSGLHADTLKITSNDHDEATVAIPLTGIGIDPPDVAVWPDSLSEAVYVGETAVQLLTITNTGVPGAHNLDFRIELWNASTATDEREPGVLSENHVNETARGKLADNLATSGTPLETESAEDTAALPWLTVNPSSGSVPPGDTWNINVTFSATSVLGGGYSGLIKIITNAPGKEEVSVPVTLDVTGVPVIALPDTVLAFGNVFVGYPESLDLTVSNVGSDVLSVTSLDFDQPGFSAVPGTFDVPPATNLTVAVTCSPPAAGPLSAVMTVSCNDTTKASPRVHLYATGVVPPLITVSPESLYAALNEGDTLTDAFTIRNTGGSPLSWTSRIVNVGQPAPEAGPNPTPERRSGVPILWYGDHGFGNTAGWSILIGDLLAKGAVLTDFYGEITLALLNQYRVLWLGDLFLPLASSELLAINSWVRSGGSLLVEADNDLARVTYQTLMTIMAAGISYSTDPVTPGFTTKIHPHDITDGVARIYFPNPYRHLYVVSPAEVVVEQEDLENNVVTAVSTIGSGHVVVVTDQIWRNTYINLADNRLFGNNVFDWLANFDWISLEPYQGQIGAGSQAEVTVTVNGALAFPGTHHRIIKLTSNDPAAPSVLLPLDILVREKRTVDLVLDAGYNLRSWNVDTETDSTATVLDPILDKLINARGFDGGGLVFDPSIPPRFNTLVTVDCYHGYWLDMLEPATLSVTGGSVDHQTPMPLDGGYNLIGYLPQFADSVAHALNAIIDKVQVVLGYDGGGLTYDPSIPPEFNTLRVMKPGYGYWVRLNEPATLTYPPAQARVNNEGIAATSGGNVSAAGEKSRATRSREWVSLWGDDIVISGLPLPTGTVITALDPDGVACGEFEVTTEGRFGLMAIYGDDPETEVDEGAGPGDEITIVVGKLGVFEGVCWTGFGDVIRFNDVATMVSSGPDQLPQKYALYQNYPNPFNPTTTIRYDLRDAGEVKLTIYNIRGERVRDLVNRHQGAGRYSVEWNGTNDSGLAVASGVYFFKLVAGDFVQTRKMVLLK